MKSLRIPLLVAVVMLTAWPAFAQATKKHSLSPETEAALQKAVKAIESWEHDATLVKEVEAQNAKNMSQADIDTIDKAWMANGEMERAVRLLSNPCATRLKALIAKNPAFSESFVMDDKGANVCMTNRTSDFWQGDEAKWQKTFLTGNTFVDDPKYDTSAKAILVQVSVPVLGDTKPVGAITVGINTGLLK